MKRLWGSGLSLFLGLLANNGRAEDLVWRPSKLQRQPCASVAVRPALSLRPPVADPPDASLKRTSCTVPGLLPMVSGQETEQPSLPPIIPVFPDATVEPPLSPWRPHLSEASPAPQAPIRPVPCPVLGGDPPESGLPCCEMLMPGCEVIVLPMHRWDASMDVLLWWIRGNSMPPLVTTAPASAPQATRGAVGAPGTTVLFGNEGASNQLRPGGRLTLGWWCDPEQCLGFEGSFFFLGALGTHFAANSDQYPVLARPFYNLNTGQEDRTVTASPSGALVRQGGITVDVPSRLWGAEANLRHNLWLGPAARLDLIAGFRYLDLQEGLRINEDFVSQQAVAGFPAFNAGNRILVSDNFNTHNQFFGGQIGLRGELSRGRWSLGAYSKFGLGSNQEVVDIAGSQGVFSPNGSLQRSNGGLLALSSNSGHNSRERFSVLSETGVKLSYQLTQRMRVFAGYEFLIWTNVVRPGGEVDPILDVTRIPNFTGVSVPNPTGQFHPAFTFHETSFWAQGINLGLEVRY